MISRFQYFKPHNLSDAVQYLEKEDNSYVLAGGTDLMILLRRNLINAEHIVDIKAIPELSALEYSNSTGLTIGAGVVVNRLVDSEIVKTNYPALQQAAASLASFQLRNRATAVGNICNASPGADLPPSLLVYDALVNITGPHGDRQVPVDQFFTGVKRTVLQRGELVVSLQLPEPGEGDRSIYLRQTRLRGHDLATVGVASRIKPNGKVAIGICAVAPTPLRLFALEDKINERGLNKETIDWAGEEINAHIRPISDVRSSALYRLQMASVLLKRGLLNLIGEEE
ncbi:MAG: xanthine dehydrogenase family protein subunit M [Chloroflexi bacterium]|jgi:carbon-monoxide dehydrogenase medium subunit|nr:xanthine dehydrogenase family protein subunit M [Chloroflexota bacterium]